MECYLYRMEWEDGGHSHSLLILWYHKPYDIGYTISYTSPITYRQYNEQHEE
jgi:hypothetical protein